MADEPPPPFGRIASGQSAGLFDPDSLIAAAQAETGRLPPLDPLARNGLDHLTRDLAALGPDLSFLGKKLLQRALIDALLKRAYTPPPGPPPPALFIVSPFRSGSTFLHRLLANDPGFRWTPTWHVSQPNAPHVAAADRIAAVRSYQDRIDALSPALRRLHPSTATSPEECFGLLEPSFLSPSFLFWGHLPGYRRWLDARSDADWAAAYRCYAAGLTGLGPPGDTRPWLLKSPFHQWGLGGLMQVFPDARLIAVTRHSGDPAASTAALLAANRDVFARRGRDTFSAADAPALIQTARAKADAARATDPGRSLDIGFQDLTAHPLDTAARLYDALGRDFAPDARHRMQHWLATSAEAHGTAPPPR